MLMAASAVVGGVSTAMLLKTTVVRCQCLPMFPLGWGSVYQSYDPVPAALCYGEIVEAHLGLSFDWAFHLIESSHKSFACILIFFFLLNYFDKFRKIVNV